MSTRTIVKAYIKILIDESQKTSNFPVVFFKDIDSLRSTAEKANVKIESISNIYPDVNIQTYDGDNVDKDQLIQNLEDELIILDEEENNLQNLLSKIIVRSKIHDLKPSIENANLLKGYLMGVTILMKRMQFNKLDPINMKSLKALKIDLNAYISREAPYRDFSNSVNSIDDPSLFKYGNNNRLKLDNYVLPNKNNFQRFINSEFTLGTRSDSSNRLPIKLWNSEKNKFDSIQPFNHQKFVSDYLSEETPYRGILLYHGLGSGKSGASILIGEGFTDRKVVVMLPASLRRNYVEEIRTFGEVAYKKNFFWQFVELGDTNTVNEVRFQEFFKMKGIENDLYLELRNEIAVGKGSSKKLGLWLVDYNKEPNYTMLSDIERASLDAQINIMFNHKYKFCNYNAGKYTIIKILEQLVPNYNIIYQQLLGSLTPKQMGQKHIDILLNHVYDSSNNVPNPFDNKVVIVDEIHNLTSGMVGGGYNSPRIYELLMRSRNSKLVFLSGTPVINFPYELGLMLNLLKGFIRVIEFNVSKRDGVLNIVELEEILNKYPFIDRYIVKSDRIQITRVPEGFINNYEGGIKIGIKKAVAEDEIEISTSSDEELILNLRGYLLENQYRIESQARMSMLTIFPDILDKTNVNKIMVGNSKFRESSEKMFNETYITEDAANLKNEISFKNRILGLISFYNEVSSEIGEEPIFPERIDAEPEDVEVIMSNYQFLEYIEYRQIEREKEEMSTRIRRSAKNSEALDNISKLFKVYTRQRGIFVFPPNVDRPLPPKKDKLSFSSSSRRDEITREISDIIVKGDKVPLKIKTYLESLSPDDKDSADIVLTSIFRKEFNSFEHMLSELESYDWGDQTTLEALDGISDVFDVDERSYNDKLMDAVNSLTEDNLTVNDTPYNLVALSPKYYKMLQNVLSSNGKSFIYSQFRAVEGVEIFARVLEANGYTKIILSDDGLSEKITIDNSVISEGKRVRVIRDRNTPSDDTEMSMSYIVDAVDGDNITLEDWTGKSLTKNDVELCKFALWTGSESVEARQTILDIYNASNNLFGEKCQVLMTTQSGAEGISLTAVRQVHIMEPYWNNVRVDQVIGRARRTYSHNELPVEMRNVKVFMYIIKYSKEQLEEPERFIENSEDIVTDYILNKKKDIIENVEESEDRDISHEEKMRIARLTYNSELMSSRQGIIHGDGGITTDEVLVDISQKKERILKRFLHLFKEVAVDCQFNRIENVRSDSELESMSCYDEPISDSDTYVYSIDNQDILESTQTERRDETRDVVMKYVNLPLKIKGKILNVLVIIPGNLASYKEVNENTPIYDYYSFKGINPDTRLDHGSKLEIGEIQVLGGKKKIKFNSDKFKPDIYHVIQECISETGAIPSIIENRSEYLTYASDITKCYNKKLGIDIESEGESIEVDEPATWTCDVCDTINNNIIDGSLNIICKECGMERED